MPAHYVSAIPTPIAATSARRTGLLRRRRSGCFQSAPLRRFYSNRRCSLIGRSIVLLFDADMRAGERAGTSAAASNATTDQYRRQTRGRRSARARRDEREAKTTRLAVVLSLFLVLLAAALLVGGRTFIDPMLHAAAEAREAHRVGEIVFAMPDGAFCRRLSFDNQTAELTGGSVRRCAPGPANDSSRATNGFAWGTR
jgi:hypothetical protein